MVAERRGPGDALERLPVYAGTSALARQGAPLPPLILSGSAIR